MSVYKIINAVQADLAKQGIGKDSENKFDNYKFRGIDAVYNALAPLLAKHGLCILPRMVSRTCEERTSQKGGALFYVTVEAEFDFVCAEDGTKHTIKTFGEAMDRGDKATNKAMSAAYKYAAFQAFAIPTEGDNDADSSTHEVKSKKIVTGARDGIGEDLPEDWKVYLKDLAAEVTGYVQAEDWRAMDEALNRDNLEADQRVYMESQMASGVRAAIKKQYAQLASKKATA